MLLMRIFHVHVLPGYPFAVMARDKPASVFYAKISEIFSEKRA